MGNVGPAILTGMLIQVLISASKGMDELHWPISYREKGICIEEGIL